MLYNFIVGNLYKRRDVYRKIGIPENTKGGNWDTGYARHNQDWFIFCNIGIPGRTGHDYDNQWVGPDLLWYGKTTASMYQPAIHSMLVCRGHVYIFVRSDQNAPFVFVGCGRPHAVQDTVPVTVLWSLTDPKQDTIATQPFATMVQESLQNTIYTVRSTQSDTFDSRNIEDARERIMTGIVRRQGQQGFRYTLLSAYEGRCCFTQTNVPEALEAAHIIPYRGSETNHPANGLLLRADIHTLFDLGRLAVDTSTMSVVLSPMLSDSDYAELAGRTLLIPREPLLRPNHVALDQHRAWTGL